MAGQFPRSFGKYTLLEPLAQGGMGALYLACQGEAGMEKLCVVKTVLKDLADKEYLARFRDEAKVVVRLSHGNLVPVFDAGTVGGELYLAMEYVDGKDLRAVWNRCAKKQIAFPTDVAVHIAREMARGLYHAHTFGDLRLVHRDISPPNVLIAFSGEVRLTDFGLASSTLKMERTAPGVIYGKVSYMSPEQARGDALDGRTDLYATAVILWELLTGRQLFPSTDADVLERVRAPRVDAPSSRAPRVKPELDGVVLKALAPEPQDRYPDCEAFRVALAEYLAREAPATDGARISSFLADLFEGEIEEERRRRQGLIEAAREVAGRARFRTQRNPAPPVAGSAPPGSGTQAEEFAEHDAEVADERSHGILGRTVDSRYRVDRLIGEGGMGRVYEAEHIEIGKRVAMKVLHPTYSRNPEAVQRFRREARAAARLGHPNIVDVTDSGTTDAGAVYFVMELLEGCDLAEVIGREGALSVERSIQITVQMCKALAAAHAAGIVHRDLKPENIFLTSRAGVVDVVKVLDFGIARHTEVEEGPAAGQRRLTNPGMAMGTPEYMAPEQAAGQLADGRCDVYAVGAILFEMLSGSPPHTGANFMEVLSKKASQVPDRVDTLRSDVSAQLADVVAGALSKDPAGRPQSMDELAGQLERCRPDRRGRSNTAMVQPLSALPEAADPATDAGSQRPGMRRWLVPAAAGAAVAFLGVGVVTLGRGGPSSPPPGIAPPTVAAKAPRSTPVAPPPVAPTQAAPQVAPTQAPPIRPAAAAPPTPKAPPAPSLRDGLRLLSNHQLDDAERLFHKLAGSPGDRGGASTGLARISFERGNYAEAVRRGKSAVQSGGGVPAHLVLGNAYLRVGRYDDAAEEYRAVLKVQPDHREARQNLEAAQRRAGGG